MPRLLTELTKQYCWPNLKEDVNQYVKTCVICQQNRGEYRKKAELLNPLPIPNGCWKSVSMDFMTHLPESKGLDGILLVVDHFSKMAHFAPTRDVATAQETARMFFDLVVWHHGLPKSIVLD